MKIKKLSFNAMAYISWVIAYVVFSDKSVSNNAADYIKTLCFLNLMIKFYRFFYINISNEILFSSI